MARAEKAHGPMRVPNLFEIRIYLKRSSQRPPEASIGLASGPARDVMQSLYAAYCASSTLELGERGAHHQDAGRKQRALMEQTYTLKGERR